MDSCGEKGYSYIDANATLDLEDDPRSLTDEEPVEVDPTTGDSSKALVLKETTNEHGAQDQDSNSSDIEPKVGMIFHSEKEAFDFYDSYARMKGFSVRKGHLDKRKDGSIRDRILLCSKEGMRRQDPNIEKTKRVCPIRRTNCMARIQFKVDRKGTWIVTKANNEHNHPLTSLDKAHMPRSLRKKLPVQHAIIDQLKSGGTRSAEAVECFADLESDPRSNIDEELIEVDPTNGQSSKDEISKDTNNEHGAQIHVSNSSDFEPKVGMVFHSEKEAFDFYDSYARKKGFSVRKGHMDKRKDGTIRDRVLLCSKEGIRRQDPSIQRSKRVCPIRRTNCMARIQFKVDRNDTWTVTKVNNEHNHPLTSLDKAHILRSQIKILPVQHAITNQIISVCSRPTQALQSLADLDADPSLANEKVVEAEGTNGQSLKDQLSKDTSKEHEAQAQVPNNGQNSKDQVSKNRSDEHGAQIEVSNSSEFEPRVGMIFHSENEAFQFYNSYARSKGFSVRKGHMDKRKDGTIRDRVLLCSNEGMRRQDAIMQRTKRVCPIRRTNCMARVRFKVDRNDTWVVTKVNNEHNHPLTSPDKAHMLRSHRHAIIDQIESFVEGAHGDEDIGSPPKYQKNFLFSKRTRELKKGDGQLLLNFLKSQKSEDPSFFYAVQVDENEQLTNFFWSDSRSIVDYSYFGDVMLFDTTYRTNMDEMPFALFIGINHHNQTTIFGAAVLLDETTETFVWLFETFLEAMSGQQPKTIFTDRCAAMAKATKDVFTETCHHLCLWHIFEHTAANLSHVHAKHPYFQKDFRNCIFEEGSEEDFHKVWQNMISKYHLEEDSWLGDLYAIRDEWALQSRRTSFCATMTMTQRNESSKKHLKKYFDRLVCLSQFIEKYQRAVNQFRQKELYEDSRSRETEPAILIPNMPMLIEAADTYTRTLYKDFENEFAGQFILLHEVTHKDDRKITYKISKSSSQSSWFVELELASCTITCTCQKYEHMGILCMHALKVFFLHDIHRLPSQYILKRWTKYAKAEVKCAKDQMVLDSNGQEPLTSYFSRVCHKAIAATVKSATSRNVLKAFETGLHQLIVEVEKILPDLDMDNNDDIISKQANGKGNINNRIMPRSPPLQKQDKKEKSTGSLKSALERSRKRKSKPSLSASSMAQSDKACAEVTFSESFDVPSCYQVCASSQLPSVPGYIDFSSEIVVPSQESFALQQNFGSSNNSCSSLAMSFKGASMSVIQQQLDKCVGWSIRPCNIPSQNTVQNYFHPSVNNGS